jgi:hypothetical protein
VKQALEEVRSSLVADAQAAKAQQPRLGALHHPAILTQSLGGVDPPAGNAWGDAAGAQGATQVRGVVGLVGVKFDRPLARPTRSSTRTDDRRNGVDQRE